MFPRSEDVASCFETRVSPLFEVRVPPVLIEASCLLSKARVPSVFEVLVPPFRVSYLQPKSLLAPTQILMYTYISTPIPLKQ